MKNILKIILLSSVVAVVYIGAAHVAFADIYFCDPTESQCNPPPVCSGDSCTFTNTVQGGGSVNFFRNPTNIVGPFNKDGQVRLYIYGLNNNPGASVDYVRITLSNGSQSYMFSVASRTVIDTAISVRQGDYVSMYVEDYLHGWVPPGVSYGYRGDVGWNAPDGANRCGSGLPHHDGGGFYSRVYVGSLITLAGQAGEPLVSKQCWDDWPEWSGDYDFEDYFIVFSYVPQQTQQPTVDLKVNGSDSSITLQAPATYTLTWTSANATSCSASNAWSGNQSLNGSQYYSNMGQGTYTYTITCTGNSGSASDTVTVYVTQQFQQYPTVDLKVNGSDSSITLQSPANYTLIWTSTNANSCAAYNAWSGYEPTNGSQYYSNIAQGTYTYTLTCTGAGGSASDSVTVYVTAYTPLTSMLSVSKLSRDTAITVASTYYDNLYTVPGREVEFSISVTNTGSIIASNVIVQDVLPTGMTYETGTTFIDGNVSVEGIVNNGIALGSISVGQTKVVRFRALVNSAATFTQMTTQIINTASARADNATLSSDTATVWVMKGQVLGASTVDTGADIATVVTFASTGVGAVMLGVYQIGRRMYWKNRIALLRKAMNV